ncbi:MAG: hypothetical protein MI919_19720 [Holophagales bacterium]|nr:hypothetical protein [Holophagales bacterium]
MREITNDANTVAYIEDPRGEFPIQPGGRSGTPTVELPVVNGNLIEVSCQFAADCDSGTFGYAVKSTSSDADQLTQRSATLQSASGWSSCSRTDIFLVTLPSGAAQDDVTFEVVFSDPDGSFSAKAAHFLLSAKVVGSKIIP